jgi:hypothetical protein
MQVTELSIHYIILVPLYVRVPSLLHVEPRVGPDQFELASGDALAFHYTRGSCVERCILTGG